MSLWNNFPKKEKRKETWKLNPTCLESGLEHVCKYPHNHQTATSLVFAWKEKKTCFWNKNWKKGLKESELLISMPIYLKAWTISIADPLRATLGGVSFCLSFQCFCYCIIALLLFFFVFKQRLIPEKKWQCICERIENHVISIKLAACNTHLLSQIIYINCKQEWT